MNTTIILAQIVGALTILSGVLIAVRRLITTTKAGRLDQKTELDAAIKMGASIREELRKDNETLRTRVAILEDHVNNLDKEIKALKQINADCTEAKENLNAQLRILKLALSKNGHILHLDDIE